MAYLNKWEILDKIKKDSENTGKVLLFGSDGKSHLIYGALGELENLGTFVEDTRISENGLETKFYGISYWSKGITDNDIIDRATITKRAFREIIGLLPLRIGKLVGSLETIYSCEGGLKSRCLKLEEFCPVSREIIRAGQEKDLAYCLGMFLQYSPSYRQRVQDWLLELDKDNFLKHPATEVLRLKRIVLHREKGYNLGKRLDKFFWLLTILMLVPKYRKMAREFIGRLDWEELKLDDADWYYLLRRSSYDFCGLSLAKRLEMAKEIDKKEDNFIIGI